jgi:hypothetical protein
VSIGNTVVIPVNASTCHTSGLGLTSLTEPPCSWTRRRASTSTPDPGAVHEADPLQVEDQLVAATVNQVDHNGLELRAGGQVNLPADVDHGTVAVVPDGESKLHHRHRLLRPGSGVAVCWRRGQRHRCPVSWRF